MDNRFGGVIWTNHALDRLLERNISQGDAWATITRPDQSRKGSAPGSWVYYKTYGDQKIEVVAKQNENKEWIILSVWSRPVYPARNAMHSVAGRQKYDNKSILRKLFEYLFVKRENRK
jgi:hypothetical protein